MRKTRRIRKQPSCLECPYYAGGHPADAIPLLEKVQGWISRANVDGYYILGICYIQTKNYDQARAAFAKMFDVPADSAAAYLFTARMLLRQEYDPIAEEYAQRAATLDPKLPLVHYLLGELYPLQITPSRIDRGIPEGAGNQSGARCDLLQTRRCLLASAEIRRRTTTVAALHLARCDVERAVHSDGQGAREKRGLRPGGDRAEACGTMEPNNPTTHHLLGQAYRDMGKKEERQTPR